MARVALAAPAPAPRLLLLAVAAGAGVSKVSGQSCHADVLVKDMDYGGLAEYERTMLGPELAKAIALQNGVSEQAVMTPDGQPGNVGFFDGSYVAPWAPPNRRPYTAGSSTIISALLSGCDEPTATLAIFRTPAAHRAIQETIQASIGGSSALSGTPTVLGVAVVPATGAPGAPAAAAAAAPAPAAPAPAAPAAPAPAAPAPAAPAAPGVVNVAPSLPGPSNAPAQGEKPLLALPEQLGGKQAQPFLIPVAVGGVLLLLGIAGYAALSKGRKKGKDDRDGFNELSSDEEEFGGH